jgi:hypothetical protein
MELRGLVTNLVGPPSQRKGKVIYVCQLKPEKKNRIKSRRVAFVVRIGEMWRRAKINLSFAGVAVQIRCHTQIDVPPPLAF